MSSEPIVLEIQPHGRIAPAAARAGFVALLLFSLGHFFIDLYSSALGTFQPILVDKLKLTLTEAGLLGGLMSLSSSVLQPGWGYLSDRFHTRMFSALAPAVAGIFVTAIILAPTYAVACGMVFLGGAGIASFHPQASARATHGIHTRRGRWMAVFISAGTLGLAAGPAFFTAVFRRVGLQHAYWAAIPGVFSTLLLLAFLPQHQHGAHAGTRRRFDWEPLLAVRKPLTIHYFLVVIRSVVQISFSQFLPLYLHRERGFSLAASGYALSLYLACGALGGFAGGHMADRYGGRRVVLISMLGCVPFLALFFWTSGVWSLFGLAAGGLVLLFTIPVNVVMAQEMAPAQAGTVSALMMGFAWGLAGVIFIPLIGWSSDHIGLQAAMSSLVMFPVLGFFLTLKLPK